MFKLLQPQRRSVLGIDITATAVKILELSTRNGKLVIENYGCEPLPPHAVDGAVINDITTVARGIKKIIDRLQLSCRRAVLAVPDTAVISKVIQLSRGLTDEEMETLIVTEADKYISYPLAEINLDFEVLALSAHNPQLLDVLLVASRAENVNQRVAVATAAGLEAVVVDVASYAVERAIQRMVCDLPGLGQNKTFAVIEVASCYTYLFVVHEMRLVYSREEQCSLSTAVYPRFQGETTRTHDKHQFPAYYAPEALASVKENILLHIRRTVQFFCATHQDGEINHLLLAGELARLPGLAALLEEQLGIKVTIANPLSSFTRSKKIPEDTLHDDAPALMVACGLALRTLE